MLNLRPVPLPDVADCVKVRDAEGAAVIAPGTRSWIAVGTPTETMLTIGTGLVVKVQPAQVSVTVSPTA